MLKIMFSATTYHKTPMQFLCCHIVMKYQYITAITAFLRLFENKD